MVLQRHEINEKDTWDLSTIYPTDQAWEEALKDLTEKVQTAAQYEGHLLDNADSLLEITEFSLDLERQVEKLYVYAHMKNDQDTREAKYQEYYAKAMTLYSQLEQAFSFYEPEFMEISEGQYVAFLEAQPKLQVYKHFFDKPPPASSSSKDFYNRVVGEYRRKLFHLVIHPYLLFFASDREAVKSQ